MALMNYRESHPLQNVFDRFFQEATTVGNAPRLALNAYETEEGLVFQAAVPGARKDSFEVSYKDQFLTLKVTLPEEKPENARFHLKEINYGEASRTLRLPFPVDADKAVAGFADGVLTLTLPKSEAAKVRTIPIA